MAAGRGKLRNRNKALAKLFEEQKGRCYLCGRPMTPALDQPNTATIDHVEPLSRSARRAHGIWKNPNRRENKRAACLDCNQGKGAAVPGGPQMNDGGEHGNG